MNENVRVPRRAYQRDNEAEASMGVGRRGGASLGRFGFELIGRRW